MQKGLLWGAMAITHQTDTNGSEDSASQSQWPEVMAAINTRNYERVSDWLHLISKSVSPDQIKLIQIALQVCLACIHCRSEIEWHGRARQEADERESELRQGLQTILAAIINDKVGEEPDVEQAPPPYLLSPSLRPKFISLLRKSSSIWKQIRTFLRQQPGQASRSDDENHLPRFEEGDHLITPQLKQEERINHAITEVEKVIIDEVHGVESKEPLLVVYCLGNFRVYQNEQAIEDWPSSKGKSIFKYLLTHRERPIAKEILMDLFWPDADPDAARNNLNVAIYSLRQAIRNGRSEFSHVLFQNDNYQLNPKLRLWTDYEAFKKGLKTAQSLERQGDLANAIREFTAAEALYQGEFLEEDRYEDWLLPQRQRLQEDYLGLLDRLTRIFYEQHDPINCANLCLKMLAIDPCREEAHRCLMRCYYFQGQSYLALRQYHICLEALKKELDIVPSRATRELYETMREHNGAR